MNRVLKSVWMIYKLSFTRLALKEWHALDAGLRNQFKTVLARRLQAPRVPSAALHGMPHCYKIKAAASGYRLIYEVNDKIVTVTVIAMGKRERGDVYTAAAGRLPH